MLPLNNTPITAAERDLAGLAAVSLGESFVPGSPRSRILRAEVAAILLANIFIELSHETPASTLDDLQTYVLQRMRAFVGDAIQALDPDGTE